MTTKSTASRSKRFSDFLFGQKLTGEALERHLEERPPRWTHWLAQIVRLIIIVALLATLFKVEDKIPVAGELLNASWANAYLVWGAGFAVLFAVEWFQNRHRTRIKQARKNDPSNSTNHDY